MAIQDCMARWYLEERGYSGAFPHQFKAWLEEINITRGSQPLWDWLRSAEGGRGQMFQMNDLLFEYFCSYARFPNFLPSDADHFITADGHTFRIQEIPLV